MPPTTGVRPILTTNPGLEAFLLLKNLSQVMAKVPDVIDHEKLKRNVLAIWSMPDIFEGIAIDSADERRQLGIIGLPELNDFRPRAILITLYANPRVLIIAGQIDARYQLQPYEPLVVVCGGIDKVS